MIKKVSEKEGLTLDFATRATSTTHEKHKKVDNFALATIFHVDQLEDVYRKLCEKLSFHFELRKDDILQKHEKSPHASYIIDFPSNKDIAREASLHAWTYIDWAERLRKILGSSIGINTKSDWYKSLLASLKECEGIRHVVQHYDRELKNFEEKNFLLTGSVLFMQVHHNLVTQILLINHKYNYDYDESIFVPSPFMPNYKIDMGSDDPQYIIFSLGSHWVDLTYTHKAILAFRERFEKEYFPTRHDRFQSDAPK